MESKIHTFITENEQNSIIAENDETYILQNEQMIHKSNLVRTTLLVHVDNDNNFYVKHSTVKFNTELPKDIMKRYGNFEKTFDNPIIVGSVTKIKIHSSQNEINLNKIKTINKFDKNKFDDADSIFNTNNSESASKQFQFAQFLENKKISCAHKKLKSTNKNFHEYKRRCSLDKFNSNFNSNKLNSNYNSFFQNLLTGEEKKKVKILEGFEKLRLIARKISKFKLNIDRVNKSMPKKKTTKDEFEKKVKQYEGLLEILEYKDIKFKSKSPVNFKLNKFGSQKEHPSSISPKGVNNRSKMVDHNDKNNLGFNTAKNKININSQKKIMSKDDISSEILKNNNEEENKKSKKNSIGNVPKPQIPRHKESENKKINLESSENKLSNGGLHNNILNLTSIDKFVFERHPNMVNKCLYEGSKNNNIINNEIDYNNYRNNLNSSIIQLKEDDENSINTSANINYNSDNVSNNSLINPVIYLKPTEMALDCLQNKNTFSSISLIDFSTEQQDFVSNNREINLNMEYVDVGHNIKFSKKRQSSIPDNYDEYESYILNLEKFPGRERTQSLNLNTNNENDYVSNSVNTYSDISNSKAYSALSNNSKITENYSYISKSSDEIEL